MREANISEEIANTSTSNTDFQDLKIGVFQPRFPRTSEPVDQFPSQFNAHIPESAVMELLESNVSVSADPIPFGLERSGRMPRRLPWRLD